MSKHSKAARRQAAARGTSETQTRSARPHSPRPRRNVRGYRRGIDGRLKASLVVGVAVAVLAGIYFLSGPGGSQAGAYPYEVGKPGPGEPALPMVLPATDGTTFDLAAHRGQTVLLYFQEGLMCPPCWDQIVEMEQNWARYEALGIDRMVSITSDPLDPSRQRAADIGISTPILSDPDLAVSKTYEANLYGMMGTAMNGHSFVLVDEEGVIRWRADYGGPPKYTMFVPSDHLVAEMREALEMSQ